MLDLFAGTNGTICTVQYHLRNASSEFSMVSTDGIKNVIVHGRAVYYAIQKDLKGRVEPDFNAWWNGKNKEMKNDELMELFRSIRNEIFKEGILPTMAEFPHGFVFSGDVGLLGASRPPLGRKVTGQIMSHQFGGVVWETTRPDGTIEYFPARFPQGVSQTLYPERLRVKHLGKEYERPTMLKLCELYVEYLEKLIAEAKKTFQAKLGVLDV